MAQPAAPSRTLWKDNISKYITELQSRGFQLKDTDCWNWPRGVFSIMCRCTHTAAPGRDFVVKLPCSDFETNKANTLMELCSLHSVLGMDGLVQLGIIPCCEAPLVFNSLCPALVLDYVPHITLKHIIKENKDFWEAVGMIACLKSLGAAISVLHECALIQCDIKPSNILIWS